MSSSISRQRKETERENVQKWRTETWSSTHVEPQHFGWFLPYETPFCILGIFYLHPNKKYLEVTCARSEYNFSPSWLNEEFGSLRWHCVPKCPPPPTPISLLLLLCHRHRLFTRLRWKRMLLLPQRPKTNPVINIDKTIAGRDARPSDALSKSRICTSVATCSMHHRFEEYSKRQITIV